MKGKSALPLALVLTNAAFNDLFDFWVIHFIKAGGLYALQTKRKMYCINDITGFLNHAHSIITEAIPIMEPHIRVEVTYK